MPSKTERRERLRSVRPSVCLDGAGVRSTEPTALPVTGKRLLARMCPSVVLEVAGL